MKLKQRYCLVIQSEAVTRLKSEVDRHAEERKKLLQYIEKLKKDLRKRSELKEPHSTIMRILEPDTGNQF